jgi:peptidylprolyl isomerase
MARLVRHRALPLVGLALALLGTAACGSPVAAPIRTIPAQCLPAEQVAATAPPGTGPDGSALPPTTDAAGSTLPPATIAKPTLTMPPAPVTDLQKTDIKVGDGTEVKEGDTVKVNYVGWSCSTGKQFDSSFDRGEPVSFALDQVIKGWGQGMVGMKVGGERVLIIPGSLGYGASPPQGSNIAPGETLAFVIDLLETGPTPVTTTTEAPTTTAAPTGTDVTTTTAAPSGTNVTTTAAP